MALMHNENPPQQDDRPVHPYSELSPDCVLDALDSVGLHGDGRLLALNSYENRVYQVGIEDSAPLVVKFYRPGRWSDAAILEEHAFVSELVEREIQVVPALEMQRQHLAPVPGLPLCRVSRAMAAARPSWTTRPPWNGSGALSAASTPSAPCRATRSARRSITQTFGVEPREFLLAGSFLPPELVAAYSSVAQQALDGVQALL